MCEQLLQHALLSWSSWQFYRACVASVVSDCLCMPNHHVYLLQNVALAAELVHGHYTHTMPAGTRADHAAEHYFVDVLYSSQALVAICSPPLRCMDAAQRSHW